MTDRLARLARSPGGLKSQAGHDRARVREVEFLARLNAVGLWCFLGTLLVGYVLK